MSGTVSAHQLLPFPGPKPGGDAEYVLPNTVQGNDNAIVGQFNAHDADATIHLSRTTTTVTTSALQIYPAITKGVYAVVYGSNGSTKTFVDTVAYDLGGTVTALSSTSTLGAADARTYTLVAGVLKLAMAAGTYTVQVCPITF